jgi:hypothetical protein
MQSSRSYSVAAALRASRTILAAGAIFLSPRAAGAQDTARTALVDSLVARLRQLEAAVDVVQKQIAEQAGSAVQTRSRARLELTGRFVVHAFSNDARVNNVDDPQFVRPDTTLLVPAGGFGMAIRQSSVGVRLFMSDVAGGRFAGDVDADFYGGQQASSGGRTFPLIRLRTARGTIRWTRAEVMVGQDMPLFSPQNPVSPAALGTPDFVAAGNLWLWLPQVRVTLQRGSALRLAAQAAVLAPTSGDPAGAFDTDFDAAERSRRPYFESRLRLRWGDQDVPGEIGCSVHLGAISVPRSPAAARDSLLTSRAAGCDARVPLTGWLEVRGEAYTGQLTRGLGGGGIGQGIGRQGLPVRNHAGWVQINLTPPFGWSGGAGCGIDAPRESDLAAGARLRNRACAAYAMARPAGPIFLGAEVRRLATRYAAGTTADTHLSLAMGFEF